MYLVYYLLRVSLFYHQDVVTSSLPGSSLALHEASEGLRKVELDDEVTAGDVNTLLNNTGRDKNIDLEMKFINELALQLARCSLSNHYIS